MEVIGPHSYRLNVPGSVQDVFNVDLLHPASEDPLPSQERDDYQPPAILADGEEYWPVEKILGEEMGKLPGQRQRQKLYVVKWEGYT